MLPDAMKLIVSSENAVVAGREVAGACVATADSADQRRHSQCYAVSETTLLDYFELAHWTVLDQMGGVCKLNCSNRAKSLFL